MPAPIHVHVYDRPADAERLGFPAYSWGRFYGRYPAFNYKHQIKAMGGFDVATFEVKMSRDEAENFMLHRIGSAVQCFGKNPNQAIWEGYINRIQITTGNLVISISLDEMGNDFRVTIQDTTASPQMNTHFNATYYNVDSRNKYGWKVLNYQWGPNFNSGTNVIDNFIHTLSNNYAFPLISAESGNTQGFKVKVECLGFHHTWKWDFFELASTALEVISTPIFYAMFPSTANIASFNTTNSWRSLSWSLFYNDQDYSQWTANTSVTVNRQRRGMHIWDYMVKFAESGDGNGKRYVVGIDPYDTSVRYRRAYYRPASEVHAYLTNAYYDSRVYDTKGHLVDPENVRPDRWIRVKDLLPGWGGEGADPRYSYINQVSFDAVRNQVVWQTLDNRSANIHSAYQTDKTLKRGGVAFGAPLPASQF